MSLKLRDHEGHMLHGTVEGRIERLPFIADLEISETSDVNEQQYCKDGAV